MIATDSNVDPHELAKFNALSQQWWDEQGPMRPLHLLNPLRLRFIQACCELKQQKIVDIGCGGGILTEALAQFSPEVLGIDQAQAVLEVATLHAQSCTQAPQYQNITVEALALKRPQAFDVVTCMELLEHVPDPAAIINACAQLLPTKGEAFFSTINRTPKAFLQAILGAEYLLKLLPQGTHEYQKFLKPSELADMARKAGFQVKQVQGISYNPLTQKFSFVNNVGVNYLMHCRKI
jgi:2-polyprenyl-6-hydroxyphenyl methylase/3-demethylubiquinone-9 3-methyltransferase